MASDPIYNVETHTYKVDDGLSLTLDVWTPSDFEKETGTCLIHFHGGFLVIGEKTTFPPMWLINACKRRKWAYVTPSYRLFPEAKGLDILNDALDASLWVRKHLTERIILAGSSAGALLAFSTAAHPRAPPALCILSIYGMIDLTAERYTVPGYPLMGPPTENAQTIMHEIEEAAQSARVIDGYAFPGDPGTDTRFTWIGVMHQEAAIPDILTRIPGLSKRIREQGIEAIPEEQRALFPTSFGVSRSWPPIALIHGDADPLVGISQSDSVAKKLESAGTRILLERVAGKGHGFDIREIPVDVDLDVHNSNDPGFYDALRRILGFLDHATSQVQT